MLLCTLYVGMVATYDAPAREQEKHVFVIKIIIIIAPRSRIEQEYIERMADAKHPHQSANGLPSTYP